MEDRMTVLDVLETIDKMLETAQKMPLTGGKVLVDPDELSDCVSAIRRGLPDDIQQARWIREEQKRILDQAREEYKKTLIEAKKEADRMVEEHTITTRAKEVALGVYNEADSYSKNMRLKTFDYIDKVLYNFRSSIAELNSKYLVPMTESMNSQLTEIDKVIENNMDQIRGMAKDVKTEETHHHDININLGNE